ncbi:3544_t:CDS:1, partial [Dentiscutata heterogama]
MDIVPIKPITLSSNYRKNILIDIKSFAHKRCLTEQKETTISTNNELESSQSILVQNEVGTLDYSLVKPLSTDKHSSSKSEN